MNDKILKLLESKDEGDNIVGLVLFKRIKGSTNKKLCEYIFNKRKWPESFYISYKYFWDPQSPKIVWMRPQWKQKINKK